MSSGTVLSQPATSATAALSTAGCATTSLAQRSDQAAAAGVQPSAALRQEYTIRCSQETADLWHQHKAEMNFTPYTDEEFLLFLLYQTVQSLSNGFSDTLILPPALTHPDWSAVLQAAQAGPKQPAAGHVTKTSPEQHQLEDAVNHECKRCKKSFRNKYYLARHVKRSCLNSVNPLRVYHCQYCAAVLRSMTSLTAHMKQKHRDVRYSCDQCNKKFKNAEYVKQHVRVAHNNIKDHKCAECGKEFTQRGSLQLHMRMVHQKLRNYLCRLCHRTYGCKSHLTRHMRKLHGDVKEQVCDICSAVFQHPTDLINHVKLMHYQTEFICNICDKAFKLKHTLAKHIIKCHSGAGPIQTDSTDNETSTTHTFI